MKFNQLKVLYFNAIIYFKEPFSEISEVISMFENYKLNKNFS